MKTPLIALACAAVLGCAAPTGSAAVAPTFGTSSNWSGYAVTAPSTSFSDVKATWVQPAATCAARETSSASFWVGLGGYAAGARGLEQIGTSSSCQNGVATYDAWYELLPAASTPIDLTVTPGDTLVAEVAGSGSTATLSLTDVTTGQTFATTLNVSVPDWSSAEVVAEAPSLCSRTCQIMPLTNFGSVSFTGVSVTGNGHAGTLTDATWTAQGIQLGTRGSYVAVPGTVATTGDAFAVAYQTPSTTTVTPPSRSPRPARPWGRGWHRWR
jgi:hypothetical protein